MPDHSQRPSFFSYLRDDMEELDQYVHRQIHVRLAQRRMSLFDERNVHTYRHGNRWTNDVADDAASEISKMSAETTIYSIDIINHDTSTLENYIENMVEQLYRSLMTHLYEAIGDAAESTGNTISTSEHNGDKPAGFLAMMKRIQFGVDRYGRATRPSLHIAPQAGKELMKALDKKPPEFHLEFEAVAREKETAAIAREAERLSRYRWKPR
ncbi:hypothetical protein AOQ72_23440 [Bradyrhizobium yuanmingense]|uniref:Uncharacterized protein n=1 Tax=Bradyrhizobium yuanmingense TaxID=108015 RepID=A0A0R3C950_9BRAD|nr:hypothetical protein [Bradyrhizobium yuanmingense]KRP94186.1 hypothetical protein AOQ72_23440 [Bradyrhizobium yuanmingense]